MLFDGGVFFESCDDDFIENDEILLLRKLLEREFVDIDFGFDVVIIFVVAFVVVVVVVVVV